MRNVAELPDIRLINFTRYYNDPSFLREECYVRVVLMGKRRSEFREITWPHSCLLDKTNILNDNNYDWYFRYIGVWGCNFRSGHLEDGLGLIIFSECCV